MARRVEIRCDVCKKPTDRIVGKLFYAPRIPGLSVANRNNYTHHLDVGVCCKERLFKGFQFHPRKTAKEYAEARKNGSS